MDRILNPRIEKQTIYEIYRACRLCGAGAGYKMPIMQNVVDQDNTEIDLKHKIRECVQIEVHQDDKMPPLICELCVDKVNDFYEFLDMCRQTNTRTRLRLGLPLQTLTKGSDGDCILGVTEPLYVNEDSDSGVPLSRHKSRTQKKALKREEVKIKIEKTSNTRNITSRRREPTPPRLTRFSRALSNDHAQIKSQTKTPKSILKKDIQVKIEDSTSLLMPRMKRGRERESRQQVPVKRVKISIKPPSPPPRRPRPPPATRCGVCRQLIKGEKGLTSHMRTHTVTFTSPRLACNACGIWFVTTDEVATHHRRHRAKSLPYHCRRCAVDFKTLNAFDDHLSSDQCQPDEEVPDVKCEKCWRLFPTRPLLEGHRCPGRGGRLGGRCSKCDKNYALMKNLVRHESTCTYRRKERALRVDPGVMELLLPMTVRVARCDPLLVSVAGGHYDVNKVKDFGFVRNCIYPYLSARTVVKTEPEFNAMVNIKDEIKEEFCSESYIHWDSSSESELEELTEKPVKKPLETLARMSLKTLFSHRCLGKVPRKRRRVKLENFDVTTSDFNMSKNIYSILDRLSDDDDLQVSKNFVRVNNDMFDDLFKNNDLDCPSNTFNDSNDRRVNDMNNATSDKEFGHSICLITDVDTASNDNTSNSKDDILDKEAASVNSGVGITNVIEREPSGDGADMKSDDKVGDTDQAKGDDDILAGVEITGSCENGEENYDNTESNVSGVGTIVEGVQSERSKEEMLDVRDHEGIDLSGQSDVFEGNEPTSNVIDKVAVEAQTFSEELTQDSGTVDDKGLDTIETSNLINDGTSENNDINTTDTHDSVETESKSVSIENSENKDLSHDTDAEIADFKPSEACETGSNQIRYTEDMVKEKSENSHELTLKHCDSQTNSLVNGSKEDLSLDDVSDTEVDDKQLMEDLDAQIGESSGDGDKQNDDDDKQSNDKDDYKPTDDKDKEDDKQTNEKYDIKNVDRPSNESNGDKQGYANEQDDDKQSNDRDHEPDNHKDNEKPSYDIETDDSKPNNDMYSDGNDKDADKKIDDGDVKVNDSSHNDSKEDKITLEDLISKKDKSLHSLDLDNISDDDFNFDV